MSKRLLALFVVGVLVGLAVIGGCNRIVYLGEEKLPDRERSQGAKITVDAPEVGEHYFGAFHPDAPFRVGDVDEFTSVAGKQPAIMMWFQPWGSEGRSEFSFAAVSELLNRGIVPLISWEPWNPPNNPRTLDDPQQNERFQLKKIAGGDFDDYIRSWARSVRELNGPVMIRVMHEMNGNWYPWGGTVNGNKPSEFVPAWHHIHSIFEEEGANNVSWVWSVNLGSVPNREDNSYDAYYPGDPYVDWIALSGFNYGDTEAWSTWTQLDDLYRTGVASLSKYEKPIMLAEVSSVESGGDKSEWITNSFSTLRNVYPNIGAVVWYNAIDDAKDFRVTSSFLAAQAFKQGVSQDWVLATAKTTTDEGGDE